MSGFLKPQGRGAGLDDVGTVGEPVDHGAAQPNIGKDRGPFAEGQMGAQDQRPALVALTQHLAPQLGIRLGQREPSSSRTRSSSRR